MPAWLTVQRSKDVFFLTLYVSINDITHPKLSVLHLSRATAILVGDCCQFGPSWIFVLKIGAYGLCRLGWRYNGAKLYF